jgi:hypothetical protein
MIGFEYMGECWCCQDCTQEYAELWEDWSAAVEMEGSSETDMSWYAAVFSM